MSSNSAQALGPAGRVSAAEAAIANPVDMVASAGADEYRRTVEIAS